MPQVISDMWIDIGIDVVQAKRVWKALMTMNAFLGKTEAEAMGLASTEIVKALVTTHVALGKTEAEAISMASTEIVVRAFLMMMAPTVALASQPPAKKCMDS